ncbi:MAG: hypothetical protein B5M51_04825, partial [Anaerolinea sp. 4484_236]
FGKKQAQTDFCTRISRSFTEKTLNTERFFFSKILREIRVIRVQPLWVQKNGRNSVFQNRECSLGQGEKEMASIHSEKVLEATLLSVTKKKLPCG